MQIPTSLKYKRLHFHPAIFISIEEMINIFFLWINSLTESVINQWFMIWVHPNSTKLSEESHFPGQHWFSFNFFKNSSLFTHLISLVHNWLMISCLYCARTSLILRGNQKILPVSQSIEKDVSSRYSTVSGKQKNKQTKKHTHMKHL